MPIVFLKATTQNQKMSIDKYDLYIDGKEIWIVKMKKLVSRRRRWLSKSPLLVVRVFMSVVSDRMLFVDAFK